MACVFTVEASVMRMEAHLIDDGHSHEEAADGEEVRPHAERDIDEGIVGVWQSHLDFMHKLCSAKEFQQLSVWKSSICQHLDARTCFGGSVSVHFPARCSSTCMTADPQKCAETLDRTHIWAAAAEAPNHEEYTSVECACCHPPASIPTKLLVLE